MPVLLPALAITLAGYATVLGVYSARSALPAENQSLAGWLTAHHLTGGLAPSYWLANVVTVDSGGRTAVRQVSVRNGVIVRPGSGWGFDRGWYQPRRHHAGFVVTGDAPGSAAWDELQAAARRTFGPPRKTYSYQRYTVEVWAANLLTRLR